MAWNATTEASTLDAASFSTTAMGNRNSSRSGAAITSNYGAGWEGPFSYNSGSTAQEFGGYSIVGISVARVPIMRQKIESEVERIQNYLNGIGQNTEGDNGTNVVLGTTQDASGNIVDATIAIKSPDMVKAINGYIESVKTYAKALLSNLLAFADKLQEVRNVWESSTQNFATSTIGSSTTSMADNSTFYQQQYGSATADASNTDAAAHEQV